MNLFLALFITVCILAFVYVFLISWRHKAPYRIVYIPSTQRYRVEQRRYLFFWRVMTLKGTDDYGTYTLAEDALTDWVEFTSPPRPVGYGGHTSKGFIVSPTDKFVEDINCDESAHPDDKG